MVLRLVILQLVFLLLAPLSTAQEDEREGGIIGTGIVGTITHLGSIFVNRQHIFIDDALPVTGAVPPRSAGALRVGHVVSVVVRPDGDKWRARHIRQILPLVGPVEAIGQGTLTVMGTSVKLDEPDPRLQIGDWVAVSGLWQGQAVRASRVEPVPDADRTARLSGTYFGTDKDVRDVVGGTVITGIKTQHLKSGDLIRVFGQPVPGGINATRLESNLFDTTVGIIQAEGYFSAPRPDGLYTILGTGLVAYTDQPNMVDAVKRTVLCGRDGDLGNPTIALDDMENANALLGRLGCTP
ncbi:DUF5666 domain-containing protein [uncultured Roseovarius sp.]|uniref:DUF5666 domain-containing protein n=1 Tax=uncultured Roseovarius sp. TaxID=293344 RepID=UPI0026292CEA|nr:DUF5666 domain-containing protein [uncultured Roseovarius sp.]